MKHYDFLIVGAGFAGAVLAERLTSAGKSVLVIDKRDHIGGNCYDYIDENGVLVHKYGPHYFRTNDMNIKKYLSQFTQWIPQKYIIKSKVNNELYSFPINRLTINKFFKMNLKSEQEVRAFLDKKREKIAKPRNVEEQVLSKVGKELYESFFKNYTIKQWGCDPKELDASITARIPIRTSDDESYVNERFQAMPKKGYTALFKNMLKGVEIRLNTEFKDIKEDVEYHNLIFTGPIDEFFEKKFGSLQYRSLKFEHEHLNQEFYQKWSQINYPNDHEYTRIVEIKHVTKQKINKTTIVKEYPRAQGDPYYPLRTKKNEKIYAEYAKQARKERNVFFVGRLASFRYLNMDEVVKLSLELFAKIKKNKNF